MIVFDDCYLCNWIVAGATRGDRWCGAGRPEFTQDGLAPCPTRLEKVELIVSHNDNQNIVGWQSATERPYVRSAVMAWLKLHAPLTKIEVYAVDRDDEFLLTFASAAQAIHFKMKWW